MESRSVEILLAIRELCNLAKHHEKLSVLLQEMNSDTLEEFIDWTLDCIKAMVDIQKRSLEESERRRGDK